MSCTMCFFVRILSFLTEEDSIHILGMHVCNFTVELRAMSVRPSNGTNIDSKRFFLKLCMRFHRTFNMDASASGDWMNVKRKTIS